MKLKLILFSLMLSMLSIIYAKGSYIENNDGTIKDNITNLIWQKCSMGQSYYISINDCFSIATAPDWESALSYCEGLDLAGRTNWRLPNINELNSLKDMSKSIGPAIDETYFPQTYKYDYWTSTAKGKDYVYVVSFKDGSTQKARMSYTKRVRCVSSGP